MMFDKIKEAIAAANNIAILPHISADPDSLGSAYALKLLLEELGKNVCVIQEQEPPISFLDFIYQGNECQSTFFDMVIAVDCADIKRLGTRIELLQNSPVSVNIDHHGTNDSYADLNAVNPDAAATGELIYDLCVSYGIKPTPQIAHNLYVAVTADTGGFRFSNTTPRTHEIGAELMRLGADAASICNLLFSSKPLKQLLVQSMLINNMTLHFNGKVAICTITKAQLESIGASDSDARELSHIPRSINGVEVGVFLREKGEPTYIKASLRSKAVVDVAKLAQKFGGGGHKHAAGADMHMDIEKAKALLLAELEGSETYLSAQGKIYFFRC